MPQAPRFPTWAVGLEESFLKCGCSEPKPVEHLEKIAISNKYLIRIHTSVLKLYDIDKGEEIKTVDDEQSGFHYDGQVFGSHSQIDTQIDQSDRTTGFKPQDLQSMTESEESQEFSCKRSGVVKSKIKELFAQENVFYSLYADGSLNKTEVGRSRDTSGLKLYHTPIPLLPIKTMIKQVSCGKEHVILLTENNQVFTFGLGSRGQLGNEDVEERKEPQEVDALSGISIKTVSAGGWHSIAVSEDGDLYTWGWNESGQLGLPCPLLSVDSDLETHGLVTLPTVIDLPASVHKVSCGSRHTTVLLEDKVLMACGWNKYGQLGTGDNKSCDQFIKLDISGAADHDIIDIVTGSWNTIFIYSSE
ncbi:hypothetical protein LOTGIDRAFT_231645 [Lottia gigantea]|uniref:RCC1 domain-containing protein n=1 Tax=Lottia gigantea TaxID=225164 RepID=V4AST6_LOTGI|nr:hypothetical protein LOTGIDRAFT_231645 [Lottia gigantea]ESO96806.1 hypothetical protein LOTGIDRAFT_231645 [Lottia gigantea]